MPKIASPIPMALSILALGAAFGAAFALFDGPSISDPAPERIEAALVSLERGGKPWSSGERIASGKSLREFYRRRGCSPAWVRSGIPDEQAWQMLAAIRDSRLDGLNPLDYHVVTLDSLLRSFRKKIFLRETPGPDAALQLEILLSDAFLSLGDHLLSGRTHPWGPKDRWHAGPEGFDLQGRLRTALDSGSDMREVLLSVAPPQPEYGLMKGYLGKYRSIQAKGGWPAIAAGPSLDTGSAGPRVESLSLRLLSEGYARPTARPDSFTADLGAAMKRFQASHGLDTTGAARKADLAQLNVPVEHRIIQIKINLECWRWLPRDLGRKHIRVNIPDYRLSVFENGMEKLRMKAIIGRKEDRTPIFRDSIVAVTLNPPWNVPATIAREEILPELRKDSGYLGKNDMELWSDTGDGAAAISPHGIDWSSITRESFHYRIRQKPGAASALGKIKFVMTNPFNVYLHDTPAVSFFDRNERAFSHGCVRVEKPVELAMWILGGEPEWDRGRLLAEIAKGKQKSLRVPEGRIPIFIVYWTAFADAAGNLNFRKDLYGWDKRLKSALPETAEAATTAKTMALRHDRREDLPDCPRPSGAPCESDRNPSSDGGTVIASPRIGAERDLRPGG